ncbi:MAG: ATP synthase F0 subunit B [Planctomycetaceae bacterium]
MIRHSSLTALAILLLQCFVSIAAAEDAPHPPVSGGAAADEASATKNAAASSEAKEHGDANAKPWQTHPDTQKPPLQLDPYLLVFTLVSFLLFINVMKSFAWQPMIEGLDERDARVVRAEQTAAKVQQEAQRLRVETEAKMAEVHAQVKSMLDNARREAEAKGAEIVAQAEAEALRVKEQALKAIEEAKQQALGELEGRVDQQVDAATSQLLNV